MSFLEGVQHRLRRVLLLESTLQPLAPLFPHLRHLKLPHYLQNKEENEGGNTIRNEGQRALPPCQGWRYDDPFETKSRTPISSVSSTSSGNIYTHTSRSQTPSKPQTMPVSSTSSGSLYTYPSRFQIPSKPPITTRYNRP